VVTVRGLGRHVAVFCVLAVVVVAGCTSGAKHTATRRPETLSSSSVPSINTPTATTAAGTSTLTKPAKMQCTSAPSGSLPNGGAYSNSNIYNSNGSNTYVANNMWGANAGSTQTVCASSPQNWTLTGLMQPADYTGVQTYPNIKQLIQDNTGDDRPISGFHTLTSTYATTNPPTDKGDWEATYDIWLSNTPNNEIMIWTTSSDQRLDQNGATVIDKNVNIGGQSFTYQNYRGGLPQIVLNSNAPSGTIDILGVLHYLQSIGQVSANAAIGEIDFGWELCNTAGTTQHFAVTGYSLSAS
jgi:hypothetical protein